jgi:HSP20 family molecular chaperone IbpA
MSKSSSSPSLLPFDLLDTFLNEIWPANTANTVNPVPPVNPRPTVASFINNQALSSQLNKYMNFQIPVDMRVENNQYIVSVELAGVKKADVDVSINEQNKLVVNAKKTVEKSGVQGFNERRTGEISRSLSLPDDCDLNNIETSFEDGVLTLKIAMKAQNVRKIVIN